MAPRLETETEQIKRIRTVTGRIWRDPGFFIDDTYAKGKLGGQPIEPERSDSAGAAELIDSPIFDFDPSRYFVFILA